MKTNVSLEQVLKKEKQRDPGACCFGLFSITPKSEEGLVSKVLRHELAQSMLPVRNTWSSNTYWVGIEPYEIKKSKFEYIRVLYHGSDTTILQKGTVLAEHLGSNSWRPEGAVKFACQIGFMGWLVLGISLTPVVFGARVLILPNEHDRGDDYKDDDIFSKIIDIAYSKTGGYVGLAGLLWWTWPVLSLYSRYYSSLLSRCVNVPATRVCRPIAKKLFSQINRGLADTGMTWAEARVRHYIQSKGVSVGESLSPFTAQDIEMLEEYMWMSGFTPEDQYYLKVIQDPRVKTRADFRKLQNKKYEMQKELAQKFGPCLFAKGVNGIHIPFERIGDLVIEALKSTGVHVVQVVDAIEGLQTLVRQSGSERAKAKYNDDMFDKMREYSMKRDSLSSAEVKQLLKHFAIYKVPVKQGEFLIDQITQDINQLIAQSPVASQPPAGRLFSSKPAATQNPVIDDIELQQVYPGV